jgi:tetratricopeptide (TPR) repeat protein
LKFWYWGTTDKETKSFVSKVRPYKGTPSNFYKFGCYLKDRKKYTLAIEEFQKVLAIDPYHVQSLNAVGICYDHLGDYNKAIISYKKSLQINPNLDYAYNNLGYSYLLKGQYNSAINAFKRAIELDYQNSRYHNNLGLAYFKTNHYFLSLDQVDIGGGRVNFYTNLAVLSEKDSDYNQENTSNSTLAMSRSQVQSEKKEEQNFSEKTEKDLFHLPPDLKGSKKDDEKLEKGLEVGCGFDQLTTHEQTKDTTSCSENIHPTIVKQKSKHKKTRVRAAKKYQSFLEYQEENRQFYNFRKKAEIEISNGNGVYRMATNIGAYLKKRNFVVARLTNAAHFHFEKTRLFYKPGYVQEAYELAKQIPGWQNMDKISELNSSDIKIKLLIGQDIVKYKDIFFENNKYFISKNY